jgi:hypothetical protein
VRAVSALGKAIKRRGRFEAPVPFGTLIEGVRFAVDSPLEEGGFEPLVPLGREVLERSTISTGESFFTGD